MQREEIESFELGYSSVATFKSGQAYCGSSMGLKFASLELKLS